MDPQQGSPLWWLHRLERRLELDRPAIERHEAYYNGRHRLAFATEPFRRSYGELFDGFADNWCELVVDAPVERLRVEGFRFAGERAADEAAWEIWQRNYLDADSTMVHTEAVKHGRAYTLVTPADPEPVISVEHPSQAIVEHSPVNRRTRLAGLKKWLGEDDRQYATVYLPGAAWRFAAHGGGALRRLGRQARGMPGWEPIGQVPNPLGAVPLVEAQNNPGMLSGGRSDIRNVIPLQDAINKLLTDAITASEFVALIQRWATGIEIPRDPETGEPLEDPAMAKRFAPLVDRMLVAESPEAKFGTLEGSDLRAHRDLIAMAVQHLAAQTRTPPHYLLGEIVNASGDALKAAETGLVAKVRRKHLTLGEGWEETIRLAFLARGDERRGQDFRAETIWANPEHRSEGETVDAAVKLGAVGVPREALWERIGASQVEIARWRDMRDSEVSAGAPGARDELERLRAENEGLKAELTAERAT